MRLKALRDSCSSQSHEIIGHHSEAYVPFFAIVFVFILICNLIGLIPGFESPTGVPIVPLGCAICAFLYYHTQGFKHAGVGYLKHFSGRRWKACRQSQGSAGPPDAADRAGQPLRASAVAHGSFVGQHFRRRSGHAGFFSMIPIGVPIIFMGLARCSCGATGVCVHAAVDHLCVGGCGRRALEAVLSSQLSVLS